MISTDRIETFKTALNKLRDSMYAEFYRTKSIDQPKKDLFFKYIDLIKGEFDAKDPIQKEFEIIKPTSFEDIELIRNIDYLYRLFEEVQADIDETGSSVWFHAAPKISRVVEAPMPNWITESTEHLWDQAIQKLQQQDTIFNESGAFDYNGAMAAYVSLLKDELAKAKKQYDITVQRQAI
jgi:hypothetical protein